MASLSSWRLRSGSPRRSTSTPISYAASSQRSSGRPSWRRRKLSATPSFQIKPTLPCSPPTTFYGGSTTHSSSCTWRKALLCALRLGGSFRSTRGYLTCFSTRMRSDWSFLLFSFWYLGLYLVVFRVFRDLLVFWDWGMKFVSRDRLICDDGVEDLNLLDEGTSCFEL